MPIIQQHERPLSGVTWQIVEELPHFDIQRRRLGAKKEHHTLKALHVKHEPQYRLRTKKGKTRYILAQTTSLGDMYAYCGAIEKEIGNADTTNWDADAWGKVADAVKQLRQVSGDSSSSEERPRFRSPQIHREDTFVTTGTTDSPTFPHVTISDVSSEDHDTDQRSITCSPVTSYLTGRLLHCLMLHLKRVTSVFTWDSPAITACGLVLVICTWYLGLGLEMLCLFLVWSLSVIVNGVQHVDVEDGDVALQKTLQWMDRQVACLLEPSSMPLFYRLLLLPSLFFLVFQWLFPAGFRLFLLILPFVSGAAYTFSPSLYLFFDFKTWLLIPHSKPLSPRVLCPEGPRSPVVISPSLRPAPLSPPKARCPAAIQRYLSENSLPAPRRRSSAPPLPSSVPTLAMNLTPLAQPSEIVPKTVKQMLELHLSEGWEVFKADRDMMIDCKSVSWSETKAFRLTTAFNCSLNAFGTWMSTPESVFKTDQLIEKRVVLEKIDEHTSIYYSTYRSPMFGVSKRDVILEMARIYFSAQRAQQLGLPPKRTFIEAASSCDHPSCPKVAGYVRSKVFCAGYIAQEEGPRHITVINLGSASPEGWIPSKVVDAVGTKLTGKIEKLRQLVEASEMSESA